MLTHDALKRLELYKNAAFPILSVYFQLPAPTNRVRSKILRNDLQRIIEHDLNAQERNQIAQDVVYVESFLEKYQQRQNEKSIALFSGGNKLYEVIHLPYIVKNQAVLSHSPYTEPILQRVQNEGRYIVILIDRSKAKLFSLASGAVETQKEIQNEGFIPKHIYGSTSEALYVNRQDKIDKHIQEHLHRYFNYLSGKLQEFIDKRPIQGVIVGGYVYLLHNFLADLSKPLRQKVLGTFVTDMKITQNELIEKSKQIIKRVHEEYMQQNEPVISV